MTIPSDAPAAAEGDDLQPAIDFARIQEFVRFVLRAPKRRPKLCVAVFLCVTAASLVANVLVPRVYHVEVKILAQAATVMPSLADPRRSIPKDADAPTRSAKEWITRHDSLVALVKSTDLLDRWNAERPTILKWKDKLTMKISGPPHDEDQMDAFIGLLDKKLVVTVDGSVVTIEIDWATASMAYELVARALENFLNERLAEDLGVINETIAILQGHADKERQTMDAALKEMTQSRAARAAAAAKEAKDAKDATPTAAASAPVHGPSGASARAPKLAASQDIASALTETRRAIQAIEDAHKRDLAELHRRRTELLAMYTSAHPSVIDLDNKIQAATPEPSELAALKSEERALAEQVDAASGSAGSDHPAARASHAAAQAAPTATAASAPAISVRTASPMLDDEAYTKASSALETAQKNYEELMARIDAARIELDTAGAAFKYRYTTIAPPELPRKPTKPKPGMIAGGGIVLALLLGIFSAASADLLSGRLIEAWQVKRRLRLDVLGDVECI